MFNLSRLNADSFIKQLEFRAEVGSTNDWALELVAAERLQAPALVLAERQTAGRGRGANRWWSADGALTFSLVLDPAQARLPTDRWPQVSLAAAVAICAALEELAPSAKLGVKWPNDVHANGRKIAGILVEAPNHARPAARRLVLGIGLNVNNRWHDAPPELQAIGTALGDLTEQTHDLTDVLLEVLSELDLRLAQLAAQDERLATAWQSLCVLTGRQVTIELPHRSVTGHAAGIAADGALVLATETGEERIYGGIVN